MALLPPELASAVREAGRALPGATAAFDADGTLWRDDVGEAFLQHLIALGLVRLPAGGGDPWADYQARVARDKPTGYAWAAQLQAGLRRAELARLAEAFAAQWVPERILPATQALLALCAEAGLRCVVVSASPIEIVRAAAPLAGVPAERCLGMAVGVEGGALTDRLLPPITYAEGKLEALGQAGLLPLALAAGDSLTGDLAMLLAARAAVAVAPGGRSPLAEEARRRGFGLLTS